MLKTCLKAGMIMAVFFFLLSLGKSFASEKKTSDLNDVGARRAVPGGESLDSEKAASDPLLLYHQGISAKTAQEREASIEKALEIYMIEYNQMKNEGKTNAFLCYNIGNCYFNLKQTGLAIYYYKMAIKLLPGQPLIAENLKTALEKRTGAIDLKTGGLREDLLFFHYKTNTRTRINTLIFFSVLTFIFYGITIFKQKALFRYLSFVMFSLFLCVGASISVEYYSPRHEGVVINPSFVRKDKGDEFSPVTPDPLGEGSIVRILSLENEWLKVEIGEGKKGYIRKEALKVVI